MEIIQAIILGLVQGLTEFIPVSSSAHLVIIPWLFGWKGGVTSSLTFDVACHLGTLVAVIVFFAKDWGRLIVAWFKSVAERKIGQDQDRRLAWFLLAACIPGGIAGVLFEDAINASFHTAPIPQASMILMAILIAAMGALMWVADALGKREITIGSIGLKDAILIGLAQALALFPGVSRSGSTITAGLALGYKREDAAKFSFLLATPIIAGSGLKSLYDLAKDFRAGSITGGELSLFPIGIAVAGISGFFCIKFLLGFLQKHSTRVFTWYRWALAALVLAVALVRG